MFLDTFRKIDVAVAYHLVDYLGQRVETPTFISPGHWSDGRHVFEREDRRRIQNLQWLAEEYSGYSLSGRSYWKRRRSIWLGYKAIWACRSSTLGREHARCYREMRGGSSIREGIYGHVLTKLPSNEKKNMNRKTLNDCHQPIGSPADT